MDVTANDATIQLVTRCSSEEEFIERFARFATETDLVVPAQPDLSVGTDGHFAISLRDRSVIMRGRCEVTEIRPIAVAPGGPPGAATSAHALMRLRLREMDAHSCGIHLRLMERHAASSGPPRAPAPAPMSVSVGGPAEDVSTGAIVAAAAAPAETEPTEISAGAASGDAGSRRRLHAARESAGRARGRRFGQLHRAHAVRVEHRRRRRKRGQRRAGRRRRRSRAGVHGRDARGRARGAPGRASRLGASRRASRRPLRGVRARRVVAGDRAQVGFVGRARRRSARPATGGRAGRRLGAGEGHAADPDRRSPAERGRRRALVPADGQGGNRQRPRPLRSRAPRRHRASLKPPRKKLHLRVTSSAPEKQSG